MIYNPTTHNRKTTRLKGFDYSTQGIYFVTICTQNRECIYGQIINGNFTPNQAGIMIEQHWMQIEQEFKNVKLDDYIVMPNHLHGILNIVGAGLVSAQDLNSQSNIVQANMMGANTVRADTRPAPTIGDIICSFKSKTTNFYIQNAKQNNWNPFNKRLWQRNYFEHIIRNHDELNKIRNYIKNNPLKWQEDNCYM